LTNIAEIQKTIESLKIVFKYEEIDLRNGDLLWKNYSDYEKKIMDPENYQRMQDLLKKLETYYEELKKSLIKAGKITPGDIEFSNLEDKERYAKRLQMHKNGEEETFGFEVISFILTKQEYIRHLNDIIIDKVGFFPDPRFLSYRTFLGDKTYNKPFTRQCF
jgi:hypothetical protein